MNAQPPDIKAIFTAALGLPAGEARAAYLDEACKENAELRSEVEELLAAEEEAGSYLNQPAVGRQADHQTSRHPQTIDYAPIEYAPGDVIGRYKLLQQIGEGGFGVVYMAQQTEPVTRKVALKIIKPGMDSKEVIARFEVERQALALMDHTNIARVLDAGATDSGRPYFVMELVKGIPITDYCDRRKLDPRARLELFIPVCLAVQHAHQKGVIHRDLKPSNVMVTLYDGTPVPKVIDFGIAKATSQRLTERTLFTSYGQFIGTPQYMSPEQSELSELDIDTRADIYALGAMLYELLCGRPPFEPERLRSAGFAEVLRIIQEEEPPRPSQRFTTLGEEASTIAEQRHTVPPALGKMLRGDLDWIVMKAMEKDRHRRYETANSVARDIQRHLHNEPVQACPPSLGYRFQKLARRNKVALATAAVVTATLVIGTTISTWQAIRATRAESIAKARLDLIESTPEPLLSRARLHAAAEDWNEAASDWVRAIDLFEDSDKWNSARKNACRELAKWPEVFTRVAQRRPNEAALWIGRGQYYVLGGQWTEAANDYARATQLSPASHWPWYQSAALQLFNGNLDAYRACCKQMIERFSETDDPGVAERTAKTCLLAPDSVQDLQPVLEIAEKAVADTEKHKDYFWFVAVRALAEYRAGDYQQVEVWLNRYRHDHEPLTPSMLAIQAMTKHQLGQPEQGRRAFERAKALMNREPKAFSNVPDALLDWVRSEILYREAAEVLGQSTQSETKKDEKGVRNRKVIRCPDTFVFTHGCFTAPCFTDPSENAQLTSG